MIVNCGSTDIQYIARTEVSNMFMNDIRKYPVLTHSEQKKLLAEAQNDLNSIKKQDAIDRLVCCNQRLVVSIAKKMANNNNFLDLVNEGNIGLIEAIDKFDMKKDNHFTTYAVFWIKKRMTEYLANKEMAVRPANMNKIYNYTNKIRQEFVQEHHRQPMLDEIQMILREKYKFNVENLGDLEIFRSVSINEMTDEEESFSVEDSEAFNAATASNNIDVDTDEDDRKELVKHLLSKLNERDAQIVCWVYGIGCTEMSVDTVAIKVGLTKERIRQIVYSSLEKLKKYNDEIFL